MAANVPLDKHTYSRNGNRAYLYVALGESNNFEGSLASGIAEFRAIRGDFDAPATAFVFRAQDDYPVVQFMPANDCNLRSIQLVKQFSPSLLFDLDFRISYPFVFPSSFGSLACRKVQNTRRKRAIRDRTPLTFHFSWSKIIRSPSYVPYKPVHSSDNIISPVCLRIEIVFRSVKNTVTNRSLINSSRIR